MATGTEAPPHPLRLLLWDARNLDVALGTILGGRPPKPQERPRFDVLARWLVERTGEDELPEACVFTNVAPDRVDAVRPWIDVLRQSGFAVFAKPKLADDDDIDGDIIEHIERRAREGPLAEVLVASADQFRDDPGGGVAALAGRVPVTILGFREFARGRETASRSSTWRTSPASSRSRSSGRRRSRRCPPRALGCPRGAACSSSTGRPARTGRAVARAQRGPDLAGSPPPVPRLLQLLAPDPRPLRESRDFRLLMLGSLVTGLGSQAALVALPFQVYELTRSPFLTGAIGLAELGPVIVASLFAGALADRHDRRMLLQLCQIALVTLSAALTAAALHGHPPVWLLFLLAAGIAGASSVERVTRNAIVPNTVPPRLLRSALSMSFGLTQVTMVVGPGVGGIMIATLGLPSAYALDAATCAGMWVAAAAMSPQPPAGNGRREPVLRSIRAGLGFVRRSPSLIGSFVIDLAAMGFGMPRALFPVLAVTVFHAGAGGAGLLLASVSAGATVAALTTGWLEEARYLGRITLVAVAVWGLAIAAAGLMTGIWAAALLFAVAGAADSVSAVCRTTIMQSVTPDDMRGRMSSVFILVVTSGPRLGDVESGGVAALATPRVSVVSGGLACVACCVLVAAFIPELVRYDASTLETLGATTA